MLMWGLGWYWIWFWTWPFRRGRHNCLTWAVDKWNNDDGYLVIRWSRRHRHDFFRHPHFLWLDKEHHTLLEHVIPPPEEMVNEDGSKKTHVIPRPWFDPQHTIGDPEDILEN